MKWKRSIVERFVVAVLLALAATDRADAADIIPIQSKEVTESSGLAASNRVPGHFWTHNDSGDGPRLFAINQQGVVTGSLVLEGANAVDWEDVASFVDQGSRRLIIADTGDNKHARGSVTLYVLEEPDPRQHVRSKSFRSITVQYPGGAGDCESIGVDVRKRLVWMVGKHVFPHVPVHSLPLPTGAVAKGLPVERVTAIHQGTLMLPMITGMDIDPRTGDIVLVNYLQCLRFPEVRDGTSRAWFLQTPQVSALPKLQQVEAVAVDADGDVWVTSEGSPASLARLPKSQPSDSEVPQ